MGDGGMLDGFHIGHLPGGLGDLVSDFASEWEDVQITSRIWERQTADGYRVDLRVHVLRGPRLSDLDGLRAFLVDYHERELDDSQLVDFPHPDGPGRATDAQAFWLTEPGVAVTVLVDPEQFGQDALLTVAHSVVRPREQAG
ncbi:hypothetical protein [Micromonospora maris]|uniref:Uncharacterized protein n=1 Tax=Micromonospora maris TaxID=1003110 RepID=A0A9X0I2G8_9ACTN|nr:hypothetical protein [Micromonospora maris]AEB46382.1 hypothetical protein VAB18032_26420 [Micromonospora maris AB-18-032]KUJ45616.1 hypothetical protein ADL17_21485 [Micromonospora maris]